MLNNLQRSRFVIWSVVILFLIVGLLSVSRAVEEEATNTAFIVASKQMLERANRFKQQYLLTGVERNGISDQPRLYSRTGWIMPIQGSERDCNLLAGSIVSSGEYFRAKLSKC